MSLAMITREEKTLNIQPEGRLDAVRTPQLDREIQPHLDGIEQIVMDFSKVEYISSSGLRLLLWLEQLMEERGGEVQLIHTAPPVMKILRLANFINVVHVITD